MKGFKAVNFVLIALVVMSLSSCSLMEKVGLRDSTSKKEVTQQETSIDMKDARKAHFERQSENTRRMMKESRKRARKYNRSRGRSWIERFLGL